MVLTVKRLEECNLLGREPLFVNRCYSKAGACYALGLSANCGPDYISPRSLGTASLGYQLRCYAVNWPRSVSCSSRHRTYFELLVQIYPFLPCTVTPISPPRISHEIDTCQCNTRSTPFSAPRDGTGRIWQKIVGLPPITV